MMAEVGDHVAAGGFEIGDDRHPRANPLEVVDVQVDLSGVGDREQVKHGIGRSTDCHDHRDRVFEGLLGHDLARLAVVPDHVEQDARCVGRTVRLLGVFSGHRGGVG